MAGLKGGLKVCVKIRQYNEHTGLGIRQEHNTNTEYTARYTQTVPL